MCVIFHFTPGSTFNKGQFFNAVHNNWHGYGLILVDGNNHMAPVIKGFDENGTDPEVLWKLIEENKDIDRYLHIRHSTKGASDETNVQPFPVYNSTNRDVFFMHNGTLSTFGGSYQNSTGKSDTLDFCEKILQPALLRWAGENGKGDYTGDEFWRLVVEKQWQSGSTGLFVSNDLPPKRIGGGWSEYKHPDESSEGVIWVSNTSYFEKVSRGPMFQKLEDERKAREAAQKAAQEQAKKTSGVVEENAPFRNSPTWEDLQDDELALSYGHWQGGVRSGNFSQTDPSGRGIRKFEEGNAAKSQKLIKAMSDLADRWDFEDPNDLKEMTALTFDEWWEWIEAEETWTIAAFLGHISEHVSKLALHNRFLDRTKRKAETRIIALQKELDSDRKTTSKAA